PSHRRAAPPTPPARPWPRAAPWWPRPPRGRRRRRGGRPRDVSPPPREGAPFAAILRAKSGLGPSPLVLAWANMCAPPLVQGRALTNRFGTYIAVDQIDFKVERGDALDFVLLGDRRQDRVDPLSGGMKRRLTIARALVNQPELLLLDEPTTGLDPQARHLVWERLYQLKLQGVTLVLTTHYMDEAEQLCDRLVIMDRARIVAEGSPRELIQLHSTREVVELRFATAEERRDALPLLNGSGERVEMLPDRILVYTGDGDGTAELVARDGLRPASVLVRRSTLEDVFLILTGRTLED